MQASDLNSSVHIPEGFWRVASEHIRRVQTEIPTVDTGANDCPDAIQGRERKCVLVVDCDQVVLSYGGRKRIAARGTHARRSSAYEHVANLLQVGRHSRSLAWMRGTLERNAEP